MKVRSVRLAARCCVCLLVIVVMLVLSVRGQTSGSQQPGPPIEHKPTPVPQPERPSSSQFITSSGQRPEQLIDAAFQRRVDLIAVKQRLAIAEGHLIQAGLRPNPQLKTEYGSTRLLSAGPQPEYDLAVGVSQLFELGGKRSKRIAVAELERVQARSQVLALEWQIAADIRGTYARALAAGRQLDTLDQLVKTGEEQARITTVRLNSGDAAPLELNLVRNETDRMRVQVISARANLEAEMISLRALVGLEMSEPLQVAPLPERPPRLEISLAELTDIALHERPDLKAARVNEQMAAARIQLAQSQAVPNVSSSVGYMRQKRVTDLPESFGVGPVAQRENTLSFGVTIDLPFFNRNQGQIASAAGERAQAERQREFLESTIKRDVALAYSRYCAAADTLILHASEIVPRSEANLRSVRLGYSEGEFSIFDTVNEQRRLLDARTGYNDALRNYYTALSELERTLGTTIPPAGFAPVLILSDTRPHGSLKQTARPALNKPLGNIPLPSGRGLP